jgi:hypothetical protein
MNLLSVWALLSVRILLFGLIFIGGRIGLSLVLQSLFPGLMQNKGAMTILTYGWFVLMLVLIYPFFIVPLRQGMTGDPSEASILSRLRRK